MTQGFAKAAFADPGWQNWTPTLTNMTLGNGTISAHYIQIGTLVIATFQWRFGSTSSVSTSNAISLPVEASTAGQVGGAAPHGFAGFRDADGSIYVGVCRYNNSTTVSLKVNKVDFTYSHDKAITSTIPFTWTTDDDMFFRIMYEAKVSALIGMGLNNDHGALSGLTDDDHSAYPKYTEFAAWTPTLTNITLGNGTVVARYYQAGGLVTAHFSFTMGSTSSVNGDISVSVPVNYNSSVYIDQFYVGVCRIRDVTGNAHVGTVHLRDTQTFRLRAIDAGSTYAHEEAMSSIIPMTWATGDEISFQVTYEAETAL